MTAQKYLGKWLDNGSQRRLVATSLYKPMTSLELCRLCREQNPSVQPQDVWALLRDMANKGIAMAVNSRLRKGRLYYLTDMGRSLLLKHFGLKRDPLDTTICWDSYGSIVCAKLRKKILGEIIQPSLLGWTENTATEIKKRLRDSHPASIGRVSRAIRELACDKLIRCCKIKKAYDQKIYEATSMGRRVMEWIKK